jgi:hypothetical protein
MFIEHKEYTCADEQKRDEVVPPEILFQYEDGEQKEDQQGDHLLDGFQLKRREPFHQRIFIIGRNHEAIFKECNTPADEYEFQDRGISKIFFQMAIPSECHKAVGDQE